MTYGRTRFPTASYCNQKRLLFTRWRSMTVREKYGETRGLIWYMIFQEMIWWRWAQLLWRNQHGLTGGVPRGDLVLLEDRLRGGRAEIWTSSSLVVQHITLINHLNASFSGPLAWTAAQNKEIESHLNQGVQSRTYMKWALSECTAGEYQSGRDGRWSNWLKEMRDTERRLIRVWKKIQHIQNSSSRFLTLCTNWLSGQKVTAQ